MASSLKHRVFTKVEGSKYTRFLARLYILLQSMWLKYIVIKWWNIPRPSILYRSAFLLFLFINKHKRKRYAKRATVVCSFFMAGIADNFKGFTAIYQICKVAGLEFKILFDGPFVLADYLEPHIHDWLITDKEMAGGGVSKKTITIRFTDTFAPFKVQRKSKKVDYLIIRTNIEPFQDKYGELFEELFKPSHKLQQAIERNSKLIGDSYVSVTFRFRELIGDFLDPDSPPPLDTDERQNLINSCIAHLKEIHKANGNTNLAIFVASDSITFKSEAKKLKFVFTIDGFREHPAKMQDISKNIHEDVWMSSFLDYFMIKNSKKAYIVVVGDMYNSNFSRYAAKHGDVPYFISRG